MLRMAQVQYIKDLYENEEKSLREISRITGHSFETVQKYAQKENWNEDNLPDTEPTSYPVLGEFIPIVDGWLEADRKVPRKQRHTVWRLFCRLRDEYGFRGSYSSVKRYARKKKYVMKVQSAGFLPLERTPGCGQVDFGEFLYYDARGQEQKGYALTISFPHSNMGYTQAFPSQNQECLLEGMKRIFEHMGGVPPRLRFDNMTTAVAQVLRGTERSLTDGFSRFMLHYRFRAEFCNPASGNEKSKVLILELWQADADALLNLPEYPFTVFRYSTLTVSKTGFVVIDTNRYGLSPVLAGEVVQAKIFFDHIEFFHDHHAVGTFRRSYKQNDEIYDWTQYVSTLCKKPWAMENTRFFHQMPQQWQTYLASTQGKERKNALQLLSEIVNDGNADLCDDALELAAQNGRTDTDSLRQCYYMVAKKEYRPDPLQLTSGPILNYNPNLSIYDGLMGGDAHG